MAGSRDTTGSDPQPVPAAPDCTMVLFGAAGDLAHRLVVPALYNLVCADRLPDGFRLLGVDIADLTMESWRQSLSDMMTESAKSGTGEFHPDKIDTERWNWLAERLDYIRGDFSADATFDAIGKKLDPKGNALFYLAVADRFFETVVANLGRAGLVQQPEGAWRRVIVEKPFGHDLASAKALNQAIGRVLGEDQTYRIDHFLGKETVQNIIVLRFANGIFEPLWSREHIDHIEITAS